MHQDQIPNQSQGNSTTITGEQALPTIHFRRRASHSAPTPSTNTMLIRRTRNIATCTGVVFALIGTYFAAQAYGQADADHAYLAGLTFIVCGVITLVLAVGVDGQLGQSGRTDELFERFEAFESRVTRRMDKIVDRENHLADLVEDELHPRRR